MRVGAFWLDDPLPDLHDPHAFAVLQPWVDVGSVGSLTILWLENQFNAQSLGRLVSPGRFFDFTRYRPLIRRAGGIRHIAIPNTFVNYARRPDGNDFVFFHLLEPHMLGEVYANAILKVLQKLDAKRYCLIGSMYDAVPHTRPLIVSGIATNAAQDQLRRLGVQSSEYEGPTTITVLVSEEAPKYDIEAMSLVVHLPQYAQIEEDYAGQLRLLEILRSLYHFSVDLEQIKRKADEQSAKLNLAMEREPKLKIVVHELEEYYEARTSKTKKEAPRLSSEIERFLREIDRRFGQTQ